MAKRNEMVEAVRLLGCATHAAYMLTLRGDIAPGLSRHFEPIVGELAMEVSTFHMRFDKECNLASMGRYTGGSVVLDNIGVLERIEREPIMTPEQFNEGVDDPSQWETPGTEQVYYLRTLDGREVRWTNAMMIRIPSDTGFMRGEPAGFKLKQSVIDQI